MSDVHEILAAGLRWLYDTSQPNGALTAGHGPVIGCGGRTYRFAVGTGGRPVVIVTVTKPVIYPGGGAANPLDPGELTDLAASLSRDLGEEVGDCWNGHPSITGSVQLTRVAHPTLQAAVARYLEGCPQHHTVFCGQEDHSGGRCRWWRDGDRLLVPPIWPPIAPAPAAVPAGADGEDR